jgi:hypothetical protein
MISLVSSQFLAMRFSLLHSVPNLHKYRYQISGLDSA